MICPRCGGFVPDNMIGCPTCADSSTRRSQYLPVVWVRDNRGHLNTRVLAGVRHVQMFAGAPKTFCGISTENAVRKGSVRFDFLRDRESHICPTCCDQIEEILREATCAARS